MHNLGSIVLALVLALMVWIVAVNEQNPPTDVTFPDAAVIEVEGLSPGLALVGEINQTVTLELTAAVAEVEDLPLRDFRAVVDLSGLGPGEHRVPIEVQCSDCAGRVIRIEKVDPAEITVKLEEIAEKEIEVLVNILDSDRAAAPGYSARLPIVTPPTVVVSGPKSEVDQVTKVVANLFLGGAKETVHQTRSLIARTDDGIVLRGVRVSPPTVEVTIPIEPRSGYKEVSVIAVTEGRVDFGYWISNIAVNPSTVTLVGNPSVIQQLPGFVKTESVDVTGARRPITRTVGLVLPEGVSVEGRDTVDVFVDVSATVGGRTVQRPAIVRGLADGLQAEVSPMNVDVILSGPLSELGGMQPDDVMVILDLSDLGIGTHQVEPLVFTSDSLKAESVVPSTLEVVISAATE
jgi:YbbR domain-containing protein